MNDGSRHLSVAEIAVLARLRNTRDLWVSDVGSVTWAEFGTSVEAARRECQGHRIRLGSVVELEAEERLGFLAWVFGAAAAGAVVVPRRGGASEAPWRNLVGVEWRLVDGRLERASTTPTLPAAEKLLAKLRVRRHPGLVLATGGTTGTPKLVLHDLAALLSVVPVKDGRPWRTLPLMRFDHIGGLDIAFRAMGAGQILVAPPREISPESVAATIERHRVEVVPATPSFLNLLLISEVHRSRDLGSLKVIPYGAEPMPVTLLERLMKALPNVEFVQRFGTSETGTLPVRAAGGGLAMGPNEDGFEWKVVDGDLWVRSPARALGYLSGDTGGFDETGWYRTGDLAETLPNGSVRILGRRTDLINVGGEKVLPDEVENALLRHPMVADCRIRPEPNALLGQVVAAEVVWRGAERDALAVKRILSDFIRGSIAAHKLPTIVRLVNFVDSTATLKKIRKATA